jgi:hypothetical protein
MILTDNNNNNSRTIRINVNTLLYYKEAYVRSYNLFHYINGEIITHNSAITSNYLIHHIYRELEK